MSLLDQAKDLVRELEFIARVRRELTYSRLIHESDGDTFDRLMNLARGRICRQCRGYGQTMSRDVCPACQGEGHMDVTPISEPDGTP